MQIYNSKLKKNVNWYFAKSMDKKKKNLSKDKITTAICLPSLWQTVTSPVRICHCSSTAGRHQSACFQPTRTHMNLADFDPDRAGRVSYVKDVFQTGGGILETITMSRPLIHLRQLSQTRASNIQCDINKTRSEALRTLWSTLVPAAPSHRATSTANTPLPSWNETVL